MIIDTEMAFTHATPLRTQRKSKLYFKSGFTFQVIGLIFTSLCF